MILSVCTGPCADRLREADWAAHPLGPIDLWPAALRQYVAAILRSSAPKVILWGPDHLAFYNDAATHLSPELGAQGIGQPFPLLRPRTWPLIETPVRQALAGEERITRTLLIPQSTRDEHLFIDTHFTGLFAGDDRPEGVMMDIHDRTGDRRLSERLLVENRHLERLFSAAPIIMAYGALPDLTLTFVNSAFRTLLDERPLEGLPAHEAIRELREQGFDTILARVLATGEPFIGLGMEICIRQRDGSERLRFLDFVYQPVTDVGGEITGILCAGVDVTERHLAQEERERLRHQVLHSSRVNAMGTMAITLAHELNQPLAAALNYMGAARRLLGDGPVCLEEALPALGKASDQINRAGEIIKRIRSVVRSGEANRRKVVVEVALDQAISLLQAGDGCSIDVERRIDEDAACVLADEVQLEQIFVNLLRNAEEATRVRGSRKAVVSCERIGELRVLVCFRDYGPGLQSDPFAGVLGQSAAGGRNGLGVGLSLCRTLVEANGGTFGAFNAKGGGAAFSFDLEACD